MLIFFCLLCSILLFSLFFEAVDAVVRAAFPAAVSAAAAAAAAGAAPREAQLAPRVARAASVAAAVTRAVVELWSRSFEDLVLCADLLALARTLSAVHASCLAALHAAAPPLVGAILAAPAAQLPPFATDAALQMALVLLDKVERDAPFPDGLGALLPSLMALLRRAEDRSAVQQACLCLQRLLRLLLPHVCAAPIDLAAAASKSATTARIAAAAAAAPSCAAAAQLLAWRGAEDGLSIGAQCAVIVRRLLRAELPEPAIMHAGVTISAVFHAFALPANRGASFDGAALAQLGALCAARLSAARMSTTRCSLLLAFARLAHADVGGLFALLSPAALATLMVAWLDSQDGFERSTHRRVGALALLRCWDFVCSAVAASQAGGGAPASGSGVERALQLAQFAVPVHGAPAGVAWPIRALRVLLDEVEEDEEEPEEEEPWAPHPSLAGLGLYPEEEGGGGFGGFGGGFGGEEGALAEGNDEEEADVADVCYADPLVACSLRWEMGRVLHRIMPVLGAELGASLGEDERAAITELVEEGGAERRT